MPDVFISYARSTEAAAHRIAGALRALGYDIWRDDELPAHRDYAEVIEERLRSAKAVVVVWSAEAAKSQWVRAEADIARESGTMVQLTLDGAPLPMPFSRIQCADMTGWTGEADQPGWRKVVGSVAELLGRPHAPASAPAPLASAAPVLATVDKPSLAVMPFANLSADPDQAYFADGMREEIIGALARYRTIFVAASGATAAFQGKAVSPQEVGRALGVRYVLDGSVRKAGARVRISVKLADAETGAQLWSDRFEDELDDVFALQDKVALSVAGVVLPHIRLSEGQRLARRPTDNLNSYDLYLRAWPLYRTVSKPGVTQALMLIERALELDPDFDEAMGLGAACCGMLIMSGWAEDPEAVRARCRDLVERTLRGGCDDEVVLGNLAVGLSTGLRERERALPLLQRALAQNPSYAVNWLNSGLMHMLAGDLETALQHLATAARLDPITLANSVRNSTAQAYFLQGRYQEALAQLGQSSLTSWSYYLFLAFIAARLGDMGEARWAYARYRELSDYGAEAFTNDYVRSAEHREAMLQALALIEDAPD
jgi:adenylate cyclase